MVHLSCLDLKQKLGIHSLRRGPVTRAVNTGTADFCAKTYEGFFYFHGGLLLGSRPPVLVKDFKVCLLIIFNIFKIIFYHILLFF